MSTRRRQTPPNEVGAIQAAVLVFSTESQHCFQNQNHCSSLIQSDTLTDFQEKIINGTPLMLLHACLRMLNAVSHCCSHVGTNNSASIFLISDLLHNGYRKHLCVLMFYLFVH